MLEINSNAAPLFEFMFDGEPKAMHTPNHYPLDLMRACIERGIKDELGVFLFVLEAETGITPEQLDIVSAQALMEAVAEFDKSGGSLGEH